MGWYRDLKAVLQGEPETWLAYLYGQQLENLSLLKKNKPRYRGFFMQVVKYFGLLLRDLRLRGPSEINHHAKYFVFSGTINQMGALEQTIVSLEEKREKVLSIVNPHALSNIKRLKGSVPIQFSLVDVVRAFLLFSIRGFSLYRELKPKNIVSIDWYFADFCSAYIYLAYFYRVLLKVKPEFVITSNDHNLPNRCMLAMAHYLEIKSVYLQHASVSPIFPALRVNYAFLDGQCALDTYRLCEGNQPDQGRDAPVPKVVLSGQKKQLKISAGTANEILGVALNALDDAKAGIDFVSAIADAGVNIRLRWHPGQADLDIVQFRDVFSNCQHVSLSDPQIESVSDFMGQIGWLVAGNSSIHLEAALAGVMPIYYEYTPPDHSDYYGYVKHGLTQSAASVAEVLELIEKTRDNHKPNSQAVRYYSSTYLTQWEGREGELVAKCLKNISEGEELPVCILEFVPEQHSPSDCQKFTTFA